VPAAVSAEIAPPPVAAVRIADAANAWVKPARGNMNKSNAARGRFFFDFIRAECPSGFDKNGSEINVGDCSRRNFARLLRSRQARTDCNARRL